MTPRKLLLLKWLMVFIPPVTVALGHVLLELRVGQQARMLGRHAESPLAAVLVLLVVTFLALALAYLFVERLFRVLRRLQAEALAREKDILIMNAVMEERERLSRDLHDGSAQLVAHLLLRLDTIKELVGAGRAVEAAAELERLHGVADEIYEDIGDSITGLRTKVTELGLVRALRDYLDQFEERYQIPTSLQADEAGERVPPLVALQLFRFIQEALTNVRKHAGARQAIVILRSQGSDRLVLVVSDDGLGFTPERQSSGKQRQLGLTSMRERVEALEGSFVVSSQPGMGTEVTATIPTPWMRGESGHAAVATPTG